MAQSWQLVRSAVRKPAQHHWMDHHFLSFTQRRSCSCSIGGCWDSGVTWNWQEQVNPHTTIKNMLNYARDNISQTSSIFLVYCTKSVSIFIVASIFMFAVSKDKTAPSSMYWAVQAGQCLSTDLVGSPFLSNAKCVEGLKWEGRTLSCQEKRVFRAFQSENPVN